MNKIKRLLFLIGETFGIASCFFIAIWLITHSEYEPRMWIRIPEILGTLIGGSIQVYQFEDLSGEKMRVKLNAIFQK